MIPDAWLEPVCHANSANALLRFCGHPPFYTESDPPLVSLMNLYELLSEKEIPPSPDLAFDFADMMEPSYHGLVGQAVVASKNLRQAIEVFVRYKPTRNRLFHYHWSLKNGEGILFFEPCFDLGLYEDFHLVSIFHTSYKILEFILGGKIAAGVGLCYSCESPAFRVFEGRFHQEQRRVSERKGLGLIIPESQLDMLNPMADAKQLKAACRSLDEELNGIEGHFTDKVKSLIYTFNGNAMDSASEYEWRSLEAIAERLFVSRSSLIRKLKLEGSSYSAILDETRRRLACWYLSETDSSVANVASLLGYKDTSNLGRVFKKWTGTTPAKYRQQTKSSVK